MVNSSRMIPISARLADLILIVDDTQPERTDNDPGQDKGDKRRHLDPVEDHPDNECDGKNDQDIGE